MRTSSSFDCLIPTGNVRSDLPPPRHPVHCILLHNPATSASLPATSLILKLCLQRLPSISSLHVLFIPLLSSLKRNVQTISASSFVVHQLCTTYPSPFLYRHCIISPSKTFLQSFSAFSHLFSQVCFLRSFGWSMCLHRTNR